MGAILTPPPDLNRWETGLLRLKGLKLTHANYNNCQLLPKNEQHD